MHLKDAGSIAALRALLRRDRSCFVATKDNAESSQDDRAVALEFIGTIDRLDISLKARESIDLAEPRSPEAAKHDGGSETVGGYLLCLLRDEYNSVPVGEGWDRLAKLGPVVVRITPLS